MTYVPTGRLVKWYSPLSSVSVASSPCGPWMTTVTPPRGWLVEASETRPVTRPVISCARATPPAASNSATPSATAAPPRMRFIRPLFRCIAALKARLVFTALRGGEGEGRDRADWLIQQVLDGRVDRDHDGGACRPHAGAGHRRDEEVGATVAARGVDGRGGAVDGRRDVGGG